MASGSMTDRLAVAAAQFNDALRTLTRPSIPAGSALASSRLLGHVTTGVGPSPETFNSMSLNTVHYKMNTIPSTKIGDFVMCFKRDGEIGNVWTR